VLREGFIASWGAPELEAVLWENPTYGILGGGAGNRVKASRIEAMHSKGAS